jgi:hypothetical protein
MRLRLLASSLLAALLTCAAHGAPTPGWLFDGHFEPVTTFTVDGQVAEIVDATPNGRTLVYTDSASQRIGFVDIGDPEAPVQFATLDMGGEPTSVAITPNGRFALVCVSGPNDLAVVKMATREIVRRIPLFGQPDSIDIGALGFHAVIVIENERAGGEAEMPDGEPGFLTILDLFGSPDRWKTRQIHLTGIANRFPTDPEPEFVAIHGNIAAVTLQENNHVVLVKLSTGEIVGDFEAGTTTHAADLLEDDQISFTDTLENARREPDGIAWTPRGRLVTANEGDYDLDLADGEFVGGRDFTIFKADGTVLFEPGASLEEAAADAGLYPDNRSENRGSEPEGVEVAHFWFHPYLFVGAERGNFVGVYRIDNEADPEFVQLLPTGDRPEGLLAIPLRGLFVTANEGDGTLSIFRFVFD